MRPLLLTCLLLLSGITANAQHALPEEFANAKWIAMEADSSILFPHVHLLKAKSEKGQTLKAYELPVLVKTTTLKKGKVKRAWADICGLGQYELFIGGSRVGDYFLSPGWTMYNKRLFYNELDVTEILQNISAKRLTLFSIEVMLGGGMYDIPLKGYHKMGGSCGAPKLLFCLHVELEDGRTQTIVSDESWSYHPSPVRYASIYAGEWYDASFQLKNSHTSLWRTGSCVITKPHWDVPLVKQQPGTFVKISRELPMEPLTFGDGSGVGSLYDTHQNCSGIVRIKVRGKCGQSITLRPAEVLKDGKIYQRCMPGYEWKYTLRGYKDGETWQPQFSYTGFRYVEVEADEGVELLELTGLHTTTDAPEVGSFECSDTLFNKIHSLIDWAIRSNLVSITTDCPTREKLGWQEQNHLMAYSLMYRYDMLPLMNKIADDLADSQHADGAIPTIAPEYVLFDAGSGFEDTPEWGASFILCPWYTYQWYGDDSALRKHYDGMKRYIGYLLSRADNYILDYGLGDWFDMGPERPGKAQLTSVALTATAMLYYELTTMQQTALHLDHKADARHFAETAALVKQAFNQRFATGDERVYENGSQTGLAMALYMNLVTDSTRQPALDALVRDIEQRGYALTAGDVGFRYVVQALQQNGRSDIIYLMNHNDTVPGYAYQLKQGATALTESWQAYDNVSNNHLMLGHLMEWLYSGLGGITHLNPQPSTLHSQLSTLNSQPSTLNSQPFTHHFMIAPQMVGDVTWARTSLNTPKGKVSCYWTRDPSKGTWTIDVTIPEGSDAEVHLPDGRQVTVKEGKHSFSSSN
ncbi:MAG: family 78 glycoside hydrolase catalytic domain [Prevotella sp.]|nr:family 78 glycoside hydrolase catalytic domain [Prevotella sp.]